MDLAVETLCPAARQWLGVLCLQKEPLPPPEWGRGKVGSLCSTSSSFSQEGSSTVLPWQVMRSWQLCPQHCQPRKGTVFPGTKWVLTYWNTLLPLGAHGTNLHSISATALVQKSFLPEGLLLSNRLNSGIWGDSRGPVGRKKCWVRYQATLPCHVHLLLDADAEIQQSSLRNFLLLLWKQDLRKQGSVISILCPAVISSLSARAWSQWESMISMAMYWAGTMYSCNLGHRSCKAVENEAVQHFSEPYAHWEERSGVLERAEEQVAWRWGPVAG